MTDRPTASALPKGVKILIGIVVALGAGMALLTLTAMVLLQDMTIG